jgi:drug/metabolite transporter (DMT)-like permease
MNVYIIIIIQLFISSGTHIVAKAVATDVEPFTLTFLRSAISGFALLVIFFLKDKRLKIRGNDLKKVLWLGFIGVPVNQFLFLYGVKYTTAANASLLYATTPVMVLVISHFYLKEKMTLLKTVGVGIALMGVAIIIFEKGVDFSSDYTYGNVVIFFAVIAWAVYTIFGKQLILRYGAFQVTAVSLIAGSIMFFPVGLFFASRFDYSVMTTAHWEGILYLGLGTSIAGYFLWYYAVGKLETAKVAIFANGQPILTTFFSVVLLHQTISPTFIAGGLLTIFGVILTQIG